MGKTFGSSFSSILNAGVEKEEKEGKEENPVPEIKKPLYVVLSSDRGLCGGINSFLAKKTRQTVEEDISAGRDPKILVLGDKASAPLLRAFPDRVIGQVHERSKTPANFMKALVLADRIISARPDADCYRLVYNNFVSAIRYDTLFQDVPNYVLMSQGTGPDDPLELPHPLNKYEGELESKDESVANLMEYALATQLYGCIIDGAASEQSARMQAMENASKNAGEMVGKLTIRYNRARQARITTELIEIISGAESLKG